MPEGALTPSFQLQKRVETLERAQSSFVAIAKAAAGRTGDDFFQVLVRSLADALQMAFVCIGEVIADDPGSIQTTALCADGRLLPNIRYELKDTPCENVVGRQLCVYPRNVQAQFPRDKLLADWGIESYLGSPLFDDAGRPLGLLSAFDRRPLLDPELPPLLLEMFAAHAANELQRLRAEQALRDSEERLRLAFDAARMGAWDWDTSGTHIRYSDNIEQLLGVPWVADHSDPDACAATVHPDDLPGLVAAVHAALRNEAEFALEFRIVLPDGSWRWLANKAQVHFDDRRQPKRMIGVAWDVTEHKRAEEDRRRLELQVRQMQKFETLGMLAGGVAHDFNNLLQVIISHATLAADQCVGAAEVQASLENIETAARRAGELTHQLLAFAGKGPAALEAVDLSALALEMQQLLEATVAGRARLIGQFASDVPRVAADPTQMRQVLLNLILNAAEALPDSGGTIHLTTGVANLTAEHLAALAPGVDLEEGRFVRLEVSDTGVGLTDEVRARMFDPFFSTRATGRGLGLSMVLGIVKRHRGAIQVDSEVGAGTTIAVLLPAAPAAGPPAFAPPDVSPQIAAPEGYVLVVDDDEKVRVSARLLLESMGFRTQAVGDGCAALVHVRESRGDVAAVLLDLAMPGLDGRDTLRELRHTHPDLPVVLCSGYTDAEAGRLTASTHASGFLQKPYRARELREAILRAITPSRAAPSDRAPVL
ncbi:MAG: response regulator [Planctomycetaceae bacterium]